MHQGPGGPQEPKRQQYPTPQTNTVPVVKVSSRFWWYLQNDPNGRLVLISAVIASAYLLFRVVDAIVLYSRISALIAQEGLATSAFSVFWRDLPKVHYITLILGVLINWSAWRTVRPLPVALSGFLYFLCAVFYIRWCIFLIPEIVLCVVAYMARVRKVNNWI